jgi:hypothetical protein
MRVLAVALAGVDGAAGEHPDAAHEAGVRRAPDEQNLEPLGAAAQQDRAAWRGLVAGPGLYSPSVETPLSPRALIG